jgi:hypothetical protein
MPDQVQRLLGAHINNFNSSGMACKNIQHAKTFSMPP